MPRRFLARFSTRPMVPAIAEQLLALATHSNERKSSR